MRSRNEFPGLRTLLLRAGPDVVLVLAVFADEPAFDEAVLWVFLDDIAGSEAREDRVLGSAAVLEVFAVFLIFDAGFAECDADVDDDDAPAPAVPADGAFLAVVDAIVDLAKPGFLSCDIVDGFRPIVEVELASDC